MLDRKHSDISDVEFALQEIGCEISPCGSRVTCNPIPDEADTDFLVFCENDVVVSRTVNVLSEHGFNWEGSEHYQQVASSSFMSWRSEHNVNMIVTSSMDFHRRHQAATALCKALNILEKERRIDLFQAVLYGNSIGERDAHLQVEVVEPPYESLPF